MIPPRQSDALTERPALRNLQALARLLDSSIGVPGTKFRLGLDPLIGLIPGVGDLAGVLLSASILLSARGGEVSVSERVATVRSSLLVVRESPWLSLRCLTDGVLLR